MKSKPRIRDTIKRLDAALALVRQDRWQLAGLRSGRLVRKTTDSSLERELTDFFAFSAGAGPFGERN